MSFRSAIRRILPPLWWGLALTLAVAYLGWSLLARYLVDRPGSPRVSSSSGALRQAEFQGTYGGEGLRILQFYARDGVLLEGQQTVICYGVVNARAVRIDPPVAKLGPSLNHCIEAAPERNTRYTLTAEGAGGQSLSSSLEIAVRPNPAEIPRITYFRAGQPRIEEGRYIFKLEFGQQNGELVEIDPPVFPTLHGAPLGQFYVAPRQTTTYTLTVTGKRGHQAKRSLTIDIPLSERAPR